MDPNILQTLWFIVIAVLWTGFLFLEGFDFGVGMLMRVFAGNELEKRVLLNTIGPVWDGNEVWLITAGGAMFAAFPLWYASLFSALYIPLLLVLLGLIFRAVAIEYRGKVDNRRWRAVWDWSVSLGSVVACGGIGAGLAATTLGLPLDKEGNLAGGSFAWLSWPVILGALAFIGFALVQGLAFVALKTAGDIQRRSVLWLGRCLPIAVFPLVIWVVAAQLKYGKAPVWFLIVAALGAVAAAGFANAKGRSGWAFVLLGAFLVFGAASIFSNMFPLVLPSTIDAAFSLTASNASSSSYTLGVMSIVAAFGVPFVLVYQSWSYWVFKKRIGVNNIPTTH